VFARVTTFQGPPERVGEGTELAKARVEEARQATGWQGVLSMADRSTRRVLTVTLWESEEALRASEQAAEQIGTQIARSGGQSVSAVERYEVVLYEPAG